ncbi:peroxiredoxin family protein [Cellulophaga lytica]|uniref:Redoxin domain protein n=1 Tax=Cellulophaga lytica (strain ATCC 23178 / DSM 7489 / JCM 8516 / NBRC 14961 / NCIMB 1423 / VKM B-1433 / Cy l20) TaxID=867900 RepID=F0RAC4_CELLC|nr:TlpA disulfide reductase family protein [Cellulophaga lytica]ADY30487.1 Redoxin domain protein [Cellulophaga lytica DSM 7489]WQG78583.1 TlpA disulfide reductase family protein [Cellulophaga lytica]
MKKLGILFIISIFVISCSEPKKITLQKGNWLAKLQVQDNKDLPFSFFIDYNDQNEIEIQVFNAEEVITVDEIVVKNDSITIKMPVFEGYLKGKFTPHKITGNFVKESLDRVVPFTAIYTNNILERFATTNSPKVNVTGIWETVFSPNTNESYIAKGIFKQVDAKVTGTFRTTTGDYRYLEGVVDGDSLKLSTFDGAHAFLFTAKATDSVLEGTFYSGNHFKEPFIAKRNKSYELPADTSLTYLNEGYKKLDFSFPDENNNLISLTDAAYKNKVVIVQIMGTWCPNCLDETKFLTEFLTEHKNKDLEIISLAFEYAKTKESAFNKIRRLKEKVNVPYPILLAQYGNSSKQQAQQKLPMLNHILSYPTTILIDRNGDVRKIHTGFNGPATGEKYKEFKTDFTNTINRLLKEKSTK